MEYKIKIENSSEPKGIIGLHRLTAIYENIRKVAEGALHVRLKGVSIHKGRRPDSYEEALEIMLCGLEKGSTILKLSSKTFAETLEQIQLDVFRQEEQNEVLSLTPVSLFINTFNDAINQGPSSKYLDKPLLQQLSKFHSAFYTDEELITITNQGAFTEASLHRQDFSTIKIIEEKVPESRPIILNGIVDVLHHSKLKVIIKVENGIVEGYLSDKIAGENIAKYWGRGVTLHGTQHFRTNNKFIIEIEHIADPVKGDEYFSHKTRFETIEQQISRQITAHGHKNRLNEVIGKWPGNEDYETLAGMLTK